MNKPALVSIVLSTLLFAACGPTVTEPETDATAPGGDPAADAPAFFEEGEVEHSAFVAPPIDPAAIEPLPPDGPIKVATTIGQITDAVEFIGEDRVVVDQVIPGEDDPHLYVPTPQDVATFSEADVVFYNGLFLEGQLGETLERMQRLGVVVVPVTAGFSDEQLLEREYSEGNFVTDPHVWFDPDLWAEAGANVATTLSALDPDNAGEYESRLTAYRQRLADVKAWGTERLATIPERQRTLVTSHDAFNYYGRTFGLNVRGLQGLSTEVEAGTNDVLELADFIVANNIPAVFVEASVSPEALRAVVAAVESEGGSVQIGGELFSDTPGRRGTAEGTYPGMLIWNTTTIVHALGGDVSADTLPERFNPHPEWEYAELVDTAIEESARPLDEAP